MASGLNRIKFPKYPIQERKLNFFVDYFRYYVHFAGLVGKMELDNPLSVVDKIIFQLEHNKDKRSEKFLRLHHQWLHPWMEWLKGYGHGESALTLLTRVMNSGNGYKEIEKERDQMLAQMVALRSELQIQMQRNSVERLKHLILCEHEDSSHFEEMMFLTEMIASELIFVREDKQEVYELFNEIFASDYRNFAYPEDMEDEKQRKEFFEARTIREVLDSILYFSDRKKKTWEVVIPVRGLSVPDDYLFKMGVVQIGSANHQTNQSVMDYFQRRGVALLKDNFLGQGTALARIKVESVTSQGAHRIASVLLNQAVEYLSMRLKGNLVTSSWDYLFTNDAYHYGFRSSAPMGELVLNKEQQVLADDNAYQYFLDHPCAASVYMLEFEPLYLRAVREDDITLYWSYLEILLKVCGEPQIQKRMAGVMTLGEREFLQQQIGYYLRHVAGHIITNHQDIGITFEQQVEIENGEMSLEQMHKIIKVRFFKAAYKDFSVKESMPWFRNTRKGYCRVAWEAYEQRNMLEHAGKVNTRAMLKLSHTFGMMVSRFRWAIFACTEKHPGLDFGKIIEQIDKDILAKVGDFECL